MSFKFTFALAIFFVFHSGPGFSQEVSVSQGDNSKTTLEQELRWLQAENFVWGASKYEQKVTDAPSSVSIITADEIKKYGYRTLADILRSIRGFYITYDRNWNYTGVRGFNRPGDYNTRILLLVDWHRINDNIFDQAYIGTTFIVDVDLIDRVEVIRGPGSSLYGNSAFFGVINVITRSAQNLSGGETAGEYARWNAYKGRLSYGHEFQNSVSVLVSGSIYDSKGQKKLYFKEFDDPATNNGIAEKADADKNYSFFAKTSYHDFTIQGAHINREKNVPTAAYEVEFNDSRFITIDQRSYVEMKYEHEFGEELDLMARLSYDRYQFDADYPFDTGINKDYAFGQLWSTELMLTKTFFEHHKLVAGGEYKDNLNQDQKNFDGEHHFDFLDDKRSTKDWALFFQDEFDILENLTVNAGVRYDHFETFGGTTNPRAAVIYSPFEDTVLKLLYGEAFRAPNAFEFYYEDAGESQKANPDLQPETIKTYELVWDQQVGENIRGTVSGFFYKINDLITQQTEHAADILVSTNVEEN